MIIKYYSGRKIQNELLGHAVQSRGINDDQVQDLISMFAVNDILRHRGVINRCWPMPYVFDITKLPDPVDTNITFDQCCLIRAQELWQQSQGRRLALFWSGGIDSTAALVALMITNSKWHEQLILYTSQSAVEKEYPAFWHRYLKAVEHKLLRNWDFIDPTLWQSDRLVVDGALGDQLWGGSRAQQDIFAFGQEPCERFFQTSFFLDRTRAHERPQLRDYIQRLVELMPIPTRTIQDLVWLLTFTHDWDHIRLQSMARVNDINLIHSTHAFFNTVHFQSWSMTNGHRRVGDQWCTYKQPAKDFIYSFTGDEDYRTNKCKEWSLQYVIDDPAIFSNKFSLISDCYVEPNQDQYSPRPCDLYNRY